MVEVIGFPKVARQTIAPGQAFVTKKDGAVLYCVEGLNEHYVLLGHGGPPSAFWGSLPGPTLILPGTVQVRPPRDRPWPLEWNQTPKPGDMVISDNGTFLKVVQKHPRGSEFTPGEGFLDLQTGRSPPGSITGPIFRAWELVCFPLPNRPMLLGTHEPRQEGMTG